MKTVNVGKKLVDKLVEECPENIDETRLVEKTSAKNKNKHKCSSCTLHIVLFSILFTINIGIGTYFTYFYWYLKNDGTCIKFGTHTETTIIEHMNGESQRNKHKICNILFF